MDSFCRDCEGDQLSDSAGHRPGAARAFNSEVSGPSAGPQPVGWPFDRHAQRLADVVDNEGVATATSDDELPHLGGGAPPQARDVVLATAHDLLSFRVGYVTFRQFSDAAPGARLRFPFDSPVFPDVESIQPSEHGPYGHKRPLDSRDRILATVATDHAGRTWLVHDVEYSGLLRHMMDPFDGEALPPEGVQEFPVSVQPPPGSQGAVEDGVLLAATYRSLDCGFDGTLDIGKVGGDDRTLVPAVDFSARMRNVVRVRTSSGGTGSAALIRSTHEGAEDYGTWFLTAAHVVVDLDTWAGGAIPGPHDLYTLGGAVTPLGSPFSSDARRAGFKILSPTYNRDSPGAAGDYALFGVRSPVGVDGRRMRISRRTDEFLEDVPHYKASGYPSRRPDCSTNSVASAHVGVIARDLYKSGGLMRSADSGFFSFGIDAGMGQSGGPVFYCGGSDDGSCTTGGQIGAIASVAARMAFGSDPRDGLRGPKMNQRRDWVCAFTGC
ncbi:MAG: hypothetical protein ACI9OJ_000305 [Myxococcota bacterium]